MNCYIDFKIFFQRNERLIKNIGEITTLDIPDSEKIDCADYSTDLDDDWENDFKGNGNHAGDNVIQSNTNSRKEAIKTIVCDWNGDLYVDINEWFKEKSCDPWEKGSGIRLSPADLLILAEHLNRAIQFVFFTYRLREK